MGPRPRLHAVPNSSINSREELQVLLFPTFSTETSGLCLASYELAAKYNCQ